MGYNYKYLNSNGLLIINFLVSTPEHVQDVAKEEEKQMATFEIISFLSTTEAGKEHYTTLFINKTFIIIITINMNLTFLSYCS